MLSAFACVGQNGTVLSQYMQNGLPLNPAFAGSRNSTSFTFSNRNQWVGIDGAPNTQTLSFHTVLKNEKLAPGLFLTNESIGISKSTGVFGNIAYRNKLYKGTLSFGLAAGVFMNKNSWKDVVTTTDGDDAIPLMTERVILPDVSFGTYYYTKKYFLSFSIPFMLGHTLKEGRKVEFNSDFSNYHMHLAGGYNYKINREWSLRPSVLVKYQHSFGAQVDVNALLGYKSTIVAGISYRSQDAILFLARFNISKQFQIGYSYDFTLNALSLASKGSHEITLQYDIKYRSRASNPRFF